MLTSEALVKLLKADGISTMMVNKSQDPSMEDDEVVVTNRVHIQVGCGYYCVTVWLDNRTLHFYPYRTQYIELKKDLQNAVAR